MKSAIEDFCKSSKTDNKRKKLIIATIIFLYCTLCIIFANRKSGFFLDEIYSYGLSNSHNAPFITSVKDGSIIDKIITKSDLLNYVVVGNNTFDFKSVYYNQTCDVHPPLFYWCFNFISSLVPFVFSKWTGIIMNMLFMSAALLCLYLVP